MIRPATAADAPTLTHIVRTSDAYAGAYRVLVARVEITPAQIARDTVFVDEREGEVVGFYSLKAHETELELDFLFVANQHLGAGIGRTLFQHLRIEAQRLGYAALFIIAHPPAEAFYLKMGAVRVGTQPPRDHITWERARLTVSTVDPDLCRDSG